MDWKDPEQRKLYHQAYYTAHRNEHAAYYRLYRAAHLEQIRASGKIYRAAKRLHKRITDHVYRVANLERLRAYDKARYARHPEKKRAHSRAYSKTHPEQTHAARVRYRARKVGVTATLTITQWRAILVAYKHRCAYCGRKPKKLTMDHVVPLSRNGTHTANNVVPACLTCNLRKQAGPPSVTPSLRLLL